MRDKERSVCLIGGRMIELNPLVPCLWRGTDAPVDRLTEELC